MQRAVDLDGDGDLDLIRLVWPQISNGAPNHLFIHRNDGTGRFLREGDISVDDGILAFSVLDFNLDGAPDIQTGIPPSVYLNDGKGKFVSPPVPFTMPGIPRADLDGDGDLDMVTWTFFGSNGSNLELLKNDGAFTFSRTPIGTIEDRAWTILYVDIDEDGDIDLVIGGFPRGGEFFFYPGQNRIFLNDGNASFTEAPNGTIPVDRSSKTIGFVTEDIDQDGDLDLFEINQSFSTLLLNDGNLRFTPAGPEVVSPGILTGEFSVLDIDGDGDGDVVRYGDVILNSGGTFHEKNSIRLPAKAAQPRGSSRNLNGEDISGADLDADGDMDLLISQRAGDQLYLNMGKRGFVDATERSLPLSGTQFPVAIGDMDGDRFPDLMLGGQIYINDGFGKMNLPAKPPTNQFPALRQQGSSMNKGNAELADFDGDGDLDYLFISGFGTHDYPYLLRLSMNQGGGILGDIDLIRMPETRTWDFEIADIDLDGDIDIVTGRTFGGDNRLANSRILENDGYGFFAKSDQKLPQVPGDVFDLVIGDIDMDGDPDITFSFGWMSHAFLLENDGAGGFTPFPSTYWPRADGILRIGDVNADGYPDLFFDRQLWINQPERKRFSEVALRPPAIPSSSNYQFLNLVDIDGDGDLDIADNFSILINAGDGTIPGTQRQTYTKTTPPDLVFADIDLDGDPDLVRGTGFQFSTTPLLYQNHQRQLDAPFLPQLGLPYRLDAYSAPGFATQAHRALIFSAFNSAMIDLPPIGLLRLDPSSLRFLGAVEIQPENGVASLHLTIPETSALLDQDLFFQAVILTSMNLADARFSNALHEVILPR